MREKISTLLFLFSLLVNNISSHSRIPCYIDKIKDDRLSRINEGIAKNKCDTLHDTQQWRKNESTSCANLRQELSYSPFDSNINYETFKLSAEAWDYAEYGSVVKETVLNVTISNIQFDRIIIRHENLASIDKNTSSYCQTIDLRNELVLPQKLFFITRVREDHYTSTQFYAQGPRYNFFKEYRYDPPRASFMSGAPTLKVFAYVDTTFKHNVILHVEPLPEHFNVTRYEVTLEYLENHETHMVGEPFNLTDTNLEFNQDNVFKDNVFYKFNIQPVAQNGTKYNITETALFIMREHPGKLIIMIVGCSALPVAIFLVLYLLYRYVTSRDKRKPNCLLVYSPTHDAHIDVMIALAEYLKACEINVMLDVLDVPNHPYKNPFRWYENAFSTANTVVLVTSPQVDETVLVTRTIYGCMQNTVLNFIQTHFGSKKKQYLALQFPYCKKSDLPPEGRALKRFKLMKHLKKLVKKIHFRPYDKYVSSNKLRNTIKSATDCVLYGALYSKPANHEIVIDIDIQRNYKKANDVDRTGESDDDISSTSESQTSSANESYYVTNLNNVDLMKYQKDKLADYKKVMD